MLDARVRELVKATIPVLKEHGVALTTHFYQRMFRHNPELQQIFNRSHNETGKQPTALALSVLAYAENIDNPAVLAPVVVGWGEIWLTRLMAVWAEKVRLIRA